MKKNLFTILAVFCVFGLGLVTTVGTGADDIIEDLVGDVDINEDVDLELDFTVDSEAEAFMPTGRAVLVDDCITDSVNGLIDSVNWAEYGIDDRLVISVTSIDLNRVMVSYLNATWAPPSVENPEITCTLTILDAADDTLLDTITETAVATASKTPETLTLDPATIAILEGYFTDPNSKFKFC